MLLRILVSSSLSVLCSIFGLLVAFMCFRRKHTSAKQLYVSPSILDNVSAFGLAQMLRDGKITSVAALEDCIKRIEEINPTINAVVCKRFDEARKEAELADVKLREARENDTLLLLPVLHGVPISVKECFAVIGMPQTSGLKSRCGFLAPQDATVVSRLREAGAIVVGVTNLSELCMWYVPCQAFSMFSITSIDFVLV